MAGLAQTFGRRVRELRAGLKMTQSQLAEQIDMSVEWVRRIENGGASPSFDTISALAKALHARPADLFADREGSAGSRLATVAESLSEAEIAWLLQAITLLRTAVGQREARWRRSDKNGVRGQRRNKPPR